MKPAGQAWLQERSHFNGIAGPKMLTSADLPSLNNGSATAGVQPICQGMAEGRSSKVRECRCQQ